MHLSTEKKKNLWIQIDLLTQIFPNVNGGLLQTQNIIDW